LRPFCDLSLASVQKSCIVRKWRTQGVLKGDAYKPVSTTIYPSRREQTEEREKPDDFATSSGELEELVSNSKQAYQFQGALSFSDTHGNRLIANPLGESKNSAKDLRHLPYNCNRLDFEGRVITDYGLSCYQPSDATTTNAWIERDPMELRRLMILVDATPSVSEDHHFSDGDYNSDIEESTKIVRMHDGHAVSQTDSPASSSLDSFPLEEEELFRIESYSPMNKEYKLKEEVEVSDGSRFLSTSVVNMRFQQSCSRSWNSQGTCRAPGRTVTTISESLHPVFFNGDVHSSPDEEKKQFYELSSRSRGESREIGNIGNWSYTTNSGNLSSHQAGDSPKNHPTARKVGVSRAFKQQLSFENEGSLDNRVETIIQSKTEHYSGDVIWHCNQKNAAKLLNHNESKSQKRSMRENHNIRLIGTKSHQEPDLRFTLLKLNEDSRSVFL